MMHQPFWPFHYLSFHLRLFDFVFLFILPRHLLRFVKVMIKINIVFVETQFDHHFEFRVNFNFDLVIDISLQGLQSYPTTIVVRNRTSMHFFQANHLDSLRLVVLLELSYIFILDL